MKKIFKEEIFKAAKDFSDEQGEVPPVFAFQEGIKWLLNKQKEKQNRMTILEQYEKSVERGKSRKRLKETVTGSASIESKYNKLMKYINTNVKETKQIKKEDCINILLQEHNIISIGEKVWEILIDNKLKYVFSPVISYRDLKKGFLGTIKNSIVLLDTSLEQQSFIVDNIKFYWKEKM